MGHPAGARRQDARPAPAAGSPGAGQRRHRADRYDAAGSKAPDPFVAHVAAGDCLTVDFTNQRAAALASFHVSKLDHTPDSSGVDVGYYSEQTVARGGKKTYRFFVDSRKLGSALVTDMGGVDTGALGLYGSINVAPQGSTFTDPATGNPVSFGTQVDVHAQGTPGYRDFTVAMADQDRSSAAASCPTRSPSRTRRY